MLSILSVMAQESPLTSIQLEFTDKAKQDLRTLGAHTIDIQPICIDTKDYVRSVQSVVTDNDLLPRSIFVCNNEGGVELESDQKYGRDPFPIRSQIFSSGNWIGMCSMNVNLPSTVTVAGCYARSTPERPPIAISYTPAASTALVEMGAQTLDIMANCFDNLQYLKHIQDLTLPDAFATRQIPICKIDGGVATNKVLGYYDANVNVFNSGLPIGKCVLTRAEDGSISIDQCSKI